MEISTSSVPEVELSVFDDLKDEITQPDVEAKVDNTNNQPEENVDSVNKRLAEEPEKNAFEVLKNPGIRKNQPHKPLKTVTNTAAAKVNAKTKQPKIYDESDGKKLLTGTKNTDSR